MTDATNLTVRDVLEQVDRRLTRLEDDLREFRQFTEQRFAAWEARSDARFATLDTKIDRNFRWHLGISIMLWLCVMSAILLK